MVMVLVDGIVVYFVKEINKINMVLIGVGVVVIVVLLVVVGFFVYKYCVMKYCYYILMVRNKLMSWLEWEDDENNFIMEDELVVMYDEMLFSVKI